MTLNNNIVYEFLFGGRFLKLMLHHVVVYNTEPEMLE